MTADFEVYIMMGFLSFMTGVIFTTWYYHHKYEPLIAYYNALLKGPSGWDEEQEAWKKARELLGGGNDN